MGECNVESTLTPVMTESCGLHTSHFGVDLTTDKYRVFRWRCVIGRRIDDGSITIICQDMLYLNAATRLVKLAVDVLEDLVAELLRDAKKCGLAGGQGRSRGTCMELAR